MRYDIEMIKSLLGLWIKEREILIEEGGVPFERKAEERKRIDNCRKALELLNEEAAPVHKEETKSYRVDSSARNENK